MESDALWKWLVVVEFLHFGEEYLNFYGVSHYPAALSIRCEDVGPFFVSPGLFLP